ncbi:AIPR protein [compost metagenome]
MASIHVASRRKDIDLSKVFVQMKLSIVEPARAIDIVPKISEFANTQNRVNAADFFANHPFHVRMEEFSRRTFAPSPDGSFKESKWFYERARGQYQDARALLTPAQRRKFDLEYPKSQLIEKTDFAKFINPWKGLPDLVSKGSQKNFAEFAKEVGRHWAKQADDFNETYYRQAIAKAIAFRETEKIVSRQPWYQGGGIRSRVVPYALAKLSHDAERHGRFVDFDAIWRSQKLSLQLTELLTIAAEAVHGVIVGAASEIPNPLEWAKQQACWSRTQALHIDWPEGWLETLVTSAEAKDAKKSAAKDQKLLNGIEAQTSVYQSGADFWAQVREWGAARKLLAPADAGVLDVAASMPMRLPTEKQAVRALEVLKRLHAEGCRLGL